MTRLQEPIHLEFSNNSIRRTTAQVDSLGIFYSISKEHGIINVRRWDQRTNSEVLVGQINFRIFRSTQIRFGGEKRWRSIQDFLRREHGFILNPCVSLIPHPISRPDDMGSARTFTGSNGTNYRWCLPWNKLKVGLLPTSRGYELISTSSARQMGTPRIPWQYIITSCSQRNRTSKSSIDRFSVLWTLSSVRQTAFCMVTLLMAGHLVSFLVMEKRRRDANKRRRSGG